MKRFLLFCFSIFLFTSHALATHIYSAALSYNHVQGNTYLFELILYQDASASVLPQVYIDIDNGDSDTLFLVSEVVKDDFITPYKILKYQGAYTFNADGFYTVTFSSSGRIAGIMNIPNSINQSIAVMASVLVDSTLGPNNSASVRMPLIDGFGLSDYPYIIDLSSTDADGDSLSYTLIPCRDDNGLPIVSYIFPTNPDPPLSVLELDSITGQITWDNPPFVLGFVYYSILLQVKEWRNGILTGITEQDRLVYLSFLGSVPEYSFGTSSIFTYPNPARDMVRFASRKEDTFLSKLSLYDAVGREVLNINNLFTKETEVDISAFEKGVYFYIVTDTRKKLHSGIIVVE